MKKLIVLLMFVSSICFGTDAIFNGTTNVNIGNGNVGIGTTAPTAKLDVNGLIVSTSIIATRYINCVVSTATDNGFIATTLTDSTWIYIKGSSITFTTIAGSLTEIDAICNVQINAGSYGGNTYYALYIDSVLQNSLLQTIAAAQHYGIGTLKLHKKLSAGQHTVCLFVNVEASGQGGNLAYVNYNGIWVKEFRTNP